MSKLLWFVSLSDSQPPSNKGCHFATGFLLRRSSKLLLGDSLRKVNIFPPKDVKFNMESFVDNCVKAIDDSSQKKSILTIEELQMVQQPGGVECGFYTAKV